MTYDNTNKGVLFPNKDRRSENDPNAKGRINIDGTEYWLSAWTNTSKDGKKYQKLALGNPVEASKSDSRPPAPPAEEPAFDDEIPF